jgi:hypothetical protein
MPIAAQFVADFSAWKAAVSQASRDLKTLEKDADTTMKAASKSTNEWASTLKTAAAAFGIAFSAKAAVDFIGTIFQMADAIDGVAKSLNISAEAAQRWKGAAEQNNATLADVTGAAQNLNKVLGIGAPGTQQALAALGLESDKLRKLGMEESFYVVTDALRGVTDAQTQTALGAELLGGNFKDLNGVINTGFRDTAGAIKTMSDDQIARLNDAKKTWKEFSDGVVLYSGIALAAVIKFVQDRAWQSIGGGDKPNPFRELPKDIQLVAEVLPPTSDAVRRAAIEYEKWEAAGRNLLDVLAGPAGLTPAIHAQVAAFLQAGASQGDIATYFKVSQASVKAVADELELAKNNAKGFSEAWKDIATQNFDWMTTAATRIQGVTDKLDAVTLRAMQARDALAAVKYGPAGGAAPAAGSPDAIQAAYDAALKGLKKEGLADPAEYELLYQQFIQDFDKAAQAAQNFGDKTDDAGKKTKDAGDQVAGAGNKAAAAAGQYTRLAEQANYAAGSFQNLYTQIGHGGGYEDALRKMNDMFSVYGKAGIPISGGLIPGSRAGGGPVTGGAPYYVGEQGPELFVPSTSGSILPHGSGGTQINVAVYGSLLTTKQELAALIDEALITAYRQGGNRLPA